MTHAPPSTDRSPLALLTLEECAEHARTSTSTVRYWIATGKLRSRRPGRRVLVRRADLAAFLELPAEDLAG